MPADKKFDPTTLKYQRECMRWWAAEEGVISCSKCPPN